MAGCYNLTNKPYLIEGAEAIAQMGSKAIKLQLSNPETTTYQWNSAWPSNLSTPLQTLQSEYFQHVLSMAELHTFIMTTYTSLGATFWKDATEEQFEQETQEIYDAALYLLHSFPDKTFVFSNWEGDWAIRGDYDMNTVPTPQSIQGMRKWYTARQAGVNKARQTYYAQDAAKKRSKAESGLSSTNKRQLKQHRVLQSFTSWSGPVHPEQPLQKTIGWSLPGVETGSNHF